MQSGLYLISEHQVDPDESKWDGYRACMATFLGARALWLTSGPVLARSVVLLIYLLPVRRRKRIDGWIMMTINAGKKFAALTIAALGAGMATFVAPTAAYANTPVDVSMQELREQVERYNYVCQVHSYCNQDWHHATMQNATMRVNMILGYNEYAANAVKQGANDVKASARLK